MSLKQDISGHESLGSTLQSLSMNTQLYTGRGRGDDWIVRGLLSINKAIKIKIINRCISKPVQPPKMKFTFRNLKKRNKTIPNKPNPVRWRPMSTLVNVFREEMLQRRSSWDQTDTEAALEVPSLLSVPAGWVVSLACSASFIPEFLFSFIFRQIRGLRPAVAIKARKKRKPKTTQCRGDFHSWQWGTPEGLAVHVWAKGNSK